MNAPLLDIIKIERMSPAPFYPNTQLSGRGLFGFSPSKNPEKKFADVQPMLENISSIRRRKVPDTKGFCISSGTSWNSHSSKT
jgi:hypothetical protein